MNPGIGLCGSTSPVCSCAAVDPICTATSIRLATCLQVYSSKGEKVMPSFKHILFPVDFSEQDSRIAPYVVCMARRYGARVTMLHAVEIPIVGYPDGMYTGFDFQGMLEQ